MSARARNALRRPIFIAAVSIGVFASALVAFIAVPQQARREARIEAAGLNNTIDTVAYVDAVASARDRLASTDSALAAGRAAYAAAAAPRARDTSVVSAAGTAGREVLAGRVVALGQLIERAENAPLPISYRALAESPELRDDPRIRALVDTLASVERERESFGALGGVDPIFVALTARVNDIGRAIQAIAGERRNTLQLELAALVPAAPVAPVAVIEVDTLALIANRLAAQVVLDSSTVALQRARETVADAERRRRAIEEAEGGRTSPLSLLAAALVLGVVLGFASALADELRRPRLADAAEAERVTGLRVLGVIRPQPVIGDRSRRASDRALPPHVDPYNDGHQLAYLHLATASPGTLVVSVTGDDAEVTAVVAVNLAAVSAEEARGTIIVDTDAVACDVAAGLGVHAEPGVVELIDGTASLPDATQSVAVGRSSAIDVIASGTAAPLPELHEITAFLQDASARLVREYDSVIIVVSEQHARAGVPASLPMPHVVYCARIGQTRISSLRQSVDAIQDAGARMVGLVIWDDATPSLPTPAELATRSRRPQRTSEHRVPVSA